jgi:signal transduction histidine kinase/DNA-binding response OmpR family regulator/streptogramin lyase
MNTAFTLILLLLFAGIGLPAQTGEAFRTEHFSTKDGLSHRWALCVHQDTKGYMWAGTYDGLNRYDGNDFVVYRPSANGKFPVAANFIYQIAETADGKFYVSSMHGILRFDPTTANFDLLLKSEVSHCTILLHQGKGMPLVDFNIENFGFTDMPLSIYELLPSGKLSLLSESHAFPSSKSKLIPVQCDKEVIWFWDFKGTYHRLGLKNQTWSSFPVTGSLEVPVDMAGNFWLPGNEGIRSVPLPQNIHPAQWSTFNIEAGKAVWLYSKDDKGVFTLYRLDLKDGSMKSYFTVLTDERFSYYRLFQPYRPSHFLDEESTVWFAGFLGLYKARRTGNMFRHYLSKPVVRIEAPPGGTSARQMAEDAAGNIYLRDAENNFYKINPESGDIKRIRLPPPKARNDEINREVQKLAAVYPNNPKSMMADRDGFIWFASILGLFRYDSAKDEFRYFNVPSFDAQYIFADLGEKILWGKEAQDNYFLNKITGESQRAPKWDFNELRYPVMVPEDNTLWSFTDTGLVKINALTLDTRYIRLYGEPREQRCLVFHRGWLWLGTSRGLEKVDPNTFAHTNFDRSKGLPGNFVYCMVADGDYLWLGTSDGLCRFNVETGAVKNFYVEDGLSHNEFNTLSALKARNGRIFMGGLNGVNAFFPAGLEGKTAVKARILLSRYSLFNTKKDSLIFFDFSNIPEVIELQPSVTALNLHLALTSYLDPAKNQYAWRMDGLDEDWYYAGNQHVAMYRHMPPGRYTFRAKAADPFGNWSENELSLGIIVLPPWYSRWWAWLAYVLLAGAIVYGFYRNQLSKKMEHAENLRLQELDEFKNRFFTNISHEFRTPLTVILGNLEIEKLEIEKFSKPAGPGISQFLNFLIAKNTLTRRNAESLLRLINQILDLAKLESNTLKINYVQGDVLPYLRYITESLHSFANAQNVRLQVESSEAAIVMDYDPERLLQIVYNLLSNAIKFTPSGGWVTLRTDLTNFENLTNLKFSVRDTGTGIPAEDLPRIFDRFFQAGTPLSEGRRVGGTGIGLSLTKELVKAMGGEITVESEVGKGTEFIVRLPIKRSPLTQPAGPLKGESHPLNIDRDSVLITTNHAPGISSSLKVRSNPESNNTILLIEDNPDVVEYLASCLDTRYRLEFAYNGRSGIEKALETVPGLIISDVMMPEKDGFEVCDTLKNDERTSHIPIILLTAKTGVESRIAGLRMGADAYLAKPFHREELLVTVQNLLEVRRKLQEKYLEISVGNQHLTGDGYLVSITDRENEFLLKLRSIIETNLSDAHLDVEAICRKIGMGRTNLHNKLNALTGLSTTIYVRKLRLQRAKELLGTTDMNISEIAFKVGFNDPKFFSRVFAEEFGSPPSKMRKK